MAAPRSFRTSPPLPGAIRGCASTSICRIAMSIFSRKDMTSRRIAEPTQSGLVSERIDRFTLHVCASPDYVAKHAPVERPQDLAAHACIVQRTYAPRSKWRFEWSGDLVEIEIAPP